MVVANTCMTNYQLMVYIKMNDMPSCQKSRCFAFSKGFQNTFVSLKLTVQLLNFHTQAYGS